MKWVCLMANMVIPGVGSVIARRFVQGAAQTILSLIGCTLFIYLIIEFIPCWRNYIDRLDSSSETALEAFKKLLWSPLIYGAVGALILKITWIWAQVTTAQVFKTEKKAVAAEEAAATQAVPPPLDSSN